MSLQSLIITDAATLISNDDFAIQVYYTPKGGTRKQINAVIGREPLESNAADRGQTLRQRTVIAVRADETYGVTNPQRGDKVEFPEGQNQGNRIWMVVEIISGDPGIFILGVSA